MTTELIETQEVVQEAKPVPANAQPLITFSVTDAAIAQMSDTFLVLTIEGPNDKVGYNKVYEARQIVKRSRVEVDKKRKELNEDALNWQRSVNAEAKRITLELEKIEDHLEREEKAYNDERARLAEEKAAAVRERYKQRTLALKELGFVFDDVSEAYVLADLYIIKDDIRDLSDEQYAITFRLAENKAQIEQERLAEQQRVIDENNRIAEEARKTEQARVDEERRKFNEQQAELKRQQDEFTAEQNRIKQETVDRLITARRQDLERAGFQILQGTYVLGNYTITPSGIQYSSEADFQQAISDAQDAQRLARSQEKEQRKADKERQKRLAPDKKTIGQFMTRLLNTQPWPEMTQVETIDFQADFYEQLRGFVDGYKTKLTEL